MRLMKKYIAMLLVVSLVSSSLPLSAFAEEIDDTTIITQGNDEGAENPSEISTVDEAEAATEASVEENIESSTEKSDVDEKTAEEKESDSLAEFMTEEEDSTEDNVNDSLSEKVTAPQIEEEMFFSVNMLGAGETDAAGIAFAESFKALLTENSIDSSCVEIGQHVTLKIGNGQGKILELLSQQVQTSEANYQNWTIDFNFSGNLTLSENAFMGLGDNDFPFQGTFTNQKITIKTSKTIFKALVACASLNDVKIDWSGKPNTPILTNYLIADDDEHTINMPLDKSTYFSPYIYEINGGTGKITLQTLNYSEAADISVGKEFQGDLGLVCCKMAENTKLQTGMITLPSGGIELCATGSVGGLVGVMENGTEFTIGESLNLTETLDGTIIGGLVGSSNGGKIHCTDEKTATINVTLISNGGTAGGIAGVVTTDTGLLADDSKVILSSVKVSNTKTCQNAGVFYGSCTATGTIYPLKGVSFAENTTKEINGTDNCGGVFGMLILNSNGVCVLEGTETDRLIVDSALTSSAGTTVYGGIAGAFVGETSLNVLIVKYCDVTVKTSIQASSDRSIYPDALGGLVGKQSVAADGTCVTADIANVKVTITDPKTTVAANTRFGGIVGDLGDKAMLITDTIAVSTDSNSGIGGGGGVVGSTHKGSIVYLKNSLNISGFQFQSNMYSGQVVAAQDSSFVYGPTLSITRPNIKIDVIGNYGEVYRIKDNFFSVDENYETTFAQLSAGSDGSYSLSSAKEYACYALAWQAGGQFPTVNGITSANWTDLQEATISLTNNIDLTGLGVGGLTRDKKNETGFKFSGTLMGNGNKITLDFGHANSGNVDTDGDGRLYFHDGIGLFADLLQDAVISNLKLAGNIRVSNRTNDFCVGGLAAQFDCNGNKSKIDISKVSVDLNVDVKEENNNIYVGGLLGSIKGDRTTELVLDDQLTTDITITANNYDGNRMHYGGAVGAIQNMSNLTITCNGATISGTIEQKEKSHNNFFGGALIGTVIPGGNGNRTVNITDLTIKDFTLTENASERQSGILGGIWDKTDVNVTKLVIKNSEIKASGVGEIGGLVYRASGKWEITSADLSGLTIDAGTAKALGLLVCHGEPYKEKINNSAGFFNVDGIYLAMLSNWETGYTVPSSINFSKSVFDEFVAYTAKADRNSDTPTYDILANGSGIISIKTANDVVNMSSGDRNTYVNRTSVGEGMQTNQFSRYYYNLPTVMKGCSGDIDTAKELLIWSVYRYAATNIQKYFNVCKVTSQNLGGTDASNHAKFDMEGLSYYPINLVNGSVTIQNADIKFYNSLIEDKESDNKLTNKLTREETQHYTMHCGLFYNFTRDASADTSADTKALKLNGVTFSGTVGKINGGSGALVCGTVKGDTKDGNVYGAQVILADIDSSEKAVTLKDLFVDSTDDYRPALISKIEGYSDLKANYVTVDTTARNMVAGSSLIGDVGGLTAKNVNLSFAGTIKIPESQVFTKALLLNSLRYDTGSATYNFFKDKDWSDTTYKHDVTYGKEISTTMEYDGKQGCYYDGYGPGNYISSTGNFDTANDFSSNLPYVALSPASNDSTHTLENKWHEIAVNVLSSDLIEGCGTYGHPYVIKNAGELAAVAACINNGTMANGWNIRVKADDTYHSASETTHDFIVTYDGGNWKKEDSTTYTGIQQYLANAYYVIEGSIELKNFIGLGANGSGGNEGVPFKGVIIGKTKSVSITMKGTTKALINYAYGCVVKNLTVNTAQSITIQRPTWDRTKSYPCPDVFYGGVIGCVLGGDTIIEDVTVTEQTGFSVSASGTNPHLVPIGGYIGVIAGGGVIFRGSITYSTGVTGTDSQLYRNPIIGRVLDGYAFYEGTGTAPDNTDKNYKINKLSGTNFLTLDGNGTNLNLTVNDAQGLLLLSAITTSGGGSTNSKAYTSGKSRNASYSDIGAYTEPDDYSKALADEGTVWSNNQTPYLLKKYADYTGNASICGQTNGVVLKFAENANWDMSGYGNGYRGISTRYVSNAVYGSNASSPVDATIGVLRMLSFDGQNATVCGIQMNVKEYNNDDFHMASMGGVFNIVWTKTKSGGNTTTSPSTAVFAQNLTLTNFSISLQYVDKDGTDVPQADRDNSIQPADGCSTVAVGGIFGSVSDITSENSLKVNYLLKNLHVKGSEENKSLIYGPNSAGGIIGASAMTNAKVTGYPGKLLSNGNNVRFGANFLNCSYDNLSITAELSAGGFVGQVFPANDNYVPTFRELGMTYNNYTSCTVTDSDLVVGSNSVITAKAKGSVAGGLFAAVGQRVGINDRSINTNTGLSIMSQDDEFQSIRLNSVDVKTVTGNYKVTIPEVSGIYPNHKGFDGVREGNSDNPGTGCAGIVGRIGNKNNTYFYDVELSNCNIAVVDTTSTVACAGGIGGWFFTNSSCVVENCKINDCSVVGPKYTGGFLGKTSNSSFILYLSNCSIVDTDIKTTINDSYCGGLVGSLTGATLNLYNTLMKNVKVQHGFGIKNHDAQREGLLCGYSNGANANPVYATGLSVFYDSVVSLPYSLMGNVNKNQINNYSGYIVFADYVADTTEVAGYSAPYVVANPGVDLNIDKRITSDAVGTIAGDTYGSVAARIWVDSKTGATNRANNFKYAKKEIYNNTTVTSIVDTKEAPVISTYKTEQNNVGPDSDFPVLVISGYDASIIEDYLNVITNNGFAEWMGKNTTYAPRITAYYYNEASHTFKKQTSTQGKNTPPSIYWKNGSFAVEKNAYDNTRNRFTLIEVDFTVKINNVNKIYTVSIPVIVKRELQYNYMTTFSYGTEFMSGIYEDLKSHVLESVGNPVSAYITYEYNREKDEYVEYDWQSFMNAGGDMLGVDKIISFSSGLPTGTQLILIDCQDANHAYKYTTSGSSISTKTDIKLGDFVSITDGTTKFRSSMGDVLKVSVSEDESGEFIALSDATGATVKVNGNYYRTITEGETIAEGTSRYKLVVPDLSQVENIPTENYYIIMTVPQQGTENFYINGTLTSKLNWVMPSKGTWLHRYNKDTEDTNSNPVGTNDESTYQISTGYKQNLVSPSNPSKIDVSTGQMQIKVRDTITFSNRQIYGDSDQLYFKLNADLNKKDNSSSDSETVLLPAGTTGIAKFYISDKDGNYYNINGEKVGDDTAAASYSWIANGLGTELILSNDGVTPLSLAKVRNAIKGNKEDGDSEIIIDVVMGIKFASTEVMNSVVPASQNGGTDEWVEFHYTSGISAQQASLTNTTARAIVNDNVGYYRSASFEATLTMDANSINQLGINPLELVPEYETSWKGKQASRLGIVSALNLANLQNIAGVLSKTDSITFTLTLKRGGRGSYNFTVSDAGDYIDFDLSSYGSNTFSWTITKEKFYDTENGKIITSDIFDGVQFTMPFDAYVFTDQKNFANYKIELTATFNRSDSTVVKINDNEAYLIYTFACIKPEYFDPALLAGS